MKKKALYIILSVLILALLMSFIDGFIKPPYLIKSVVKIVLFLIVPMVYFALYKKERKQLKEIFIPKSKDFFRAIVLGVAVYGVIVGAYFLLRGVFDFSMIAGSLTADVGVSAENFVFVALYISFVNSLLEEFFFRGFAFITLKEQTGRKFAYIFSAFLFALYHVGMTAGWFHIVVFILAFLGLFLGGLIFNYLNEKCKNIYPSWLVHMCANFATNTIGFILFGIF